jgi:hypothetical protein
MYVSRAVGYQHFAVISYREFLIMNINIKG